MQIPTLVRPLIFLIDIYLHVICLLHSVNLTQWRFLITSRPCDHASGDQLGYLQYRTVDRRHVQHSITENVT